MTSSTKAGGERCGHCGETEADHNEGGIVGACDGFGGVLFFTPGPTYADLEAEIARLRHALFGVRGYFIDADTDTVCGVRADDAEDVIARIDSALAPSKGRT